MSEDERKFLEIVDLKKVLEAEKPVGGAARNELFGCKGRILRASGAFRIGKVYAAQYHWWD